LIEDRNARSKELQPYAVSIFASMNSRLEGNKFWDAIMNVETHFLE
jgi:hypothetical protein